MEIWLMAKAWNADKAIIFLNQNLEVFKGQGLDITSQGLGRVLMLRHKGF